MDINVKGRWVGQIPVEIPQRCPICGRVQTASIQLGSSWIECIQCGENLEGMWNKITREETAGDKSFAVFGKVIVVRKGDGITIR